MGRWLISTLTDEVRELWRETMSSHYLRGISENEREYDYRERILVYDDERDEFSNKIQYQPEVQRVSAYDYEDDFICPGFCNAKTIYKVENQEEHGACLVEPMYPEQTILSDLLPDETIPDDRIRYFVIHKRILDDGKNTETYKIVGNDRTNKYIGLQELNALMGKGLIVNYEDLNVRLSIYYEAHEKSNRKKMMSEAQQLADAGMRMGNVYPELDYVFLGDEVIITGINRRWMEKQESIPIIKRLYIPDGVTKIADGAFMIDDYENYIISVRLPSTIKEIGSFAFYGRSELASIEFDNAKIKRIGDYAFSFCTYLKLELDIYSGFKEFENGAFYECNSVNVNFTETPSVHRIGIAAFRGTKVSMELPVSLKEIDVMAFFESKFTDKDIVIPDSVTIIGDSAFSGCDLSTIVLPKNLSVLSDNLFDDSKLIQLPELPGNLVRIGKCCFSGCSEMIGILYVPGTIEEIGEWAFENTAISKVVFTAKLDNIPGFVFYDCFNLKEVILPDGLTSIGYMSFYNCKSLTGIHIPSSVHTISKEAFTGCSSLDRVDYESEKGIINDEKG